jgi:hypothetical protein
MYKVTYYLSDTDITDARWFQSESEIDEWVQRQKELEPNTEIITITKEP